MFDTQTVEWLPALVLLQDFGGDWDNYFEEIYTCFKRDFVDRKPIYKGQKVGLKKHPLTHGKEATFWHLISEGNIESERTPDLRRCERIRWPAQIIENSEDSRILVWVEKIKNEDRIHLLCPQERYLLVLAIRQGYILPWTAFYMEYEHQVAKKLKKYKESKKLMPPPRETAS